MNQSDYFRDGSLAWLLNLGLALSLSVRGRIGMRLLGVLPKTPGSGFEYLAKSADSRTPVLWLNGVRFGSILVFRGVKAYSFILYGSSIIAFTGKIFRLYVAVIWRPAI